MFAIYESAPFPYMHFMKIVYNFSKRSFPLYSQRALQLNFLKFYCFIAPINQIEHVLKIYSTLETRRAQIKKMLYCSSESIFVLLENLIDQSFWEKVTLLWLCWISVENFFATQLILDAMFCWFISLWYSAKNRLIHFVLFV